MKLDSIVARKPLLESVQYGMTVEQRRIVEGIVREFMPLYEATLTKDQIDQLFGTVEKSASNRTMVGKGVDAAKKANEILGKVGKWMQDTTPVSGFDGKFEQLKKKISDKHPELAKRLTAMGTWAKENPGKTAAVIGVLTSIAAIASGGTGGAIAGQVLRGATELLKGEKLSTAIGRGLKTAAAGYALGKIVDFGKEVVANIGGEKVDALRYSFNNIGTSDSGMSYINIDPDTKKAVGQVMLQNNIYKPGDAGYADAVKTLMKNVSDAQAGGITPAAADAFVAGIESVILQQRPLSEGQVYLVFQRLDEGPFDAVKKVAGKAAGAVGGAIARGAEKVGTALTQKNTAQGLAKAWTKAGSPTDSDELYKFLLSQKVDKDALSGIYQDMKLPVPQGFEEPQAEPEAEPTSGTTDAGGTATDAEPEDDTMKRAADTPGAPDDFKQAAQAQQGGGNVVQMPRQVDLNKLAQDIKAQGREVVQKVKVQLTKDLKSA